MEIWGILLIFVYALKFKDWKVLVSIPLLLSTFFVQYIAIAGLRGNPSLLLTFGILISVLFYFGFLTLAYFAIRRKSCLLAVATLLIIPAVYKYTIAMLIPAMDWRSALDNTLVFFAFNVRVPLVLIACLAIVILLLHRNSKNKESANISKLKRRILVAYKIVVLLFVFLAAIALSTGYAVDYMFGPRSDDLSDKEARKLVLRYTQDCSNGGDPKVFAASGPTGDFGTWAEAQILPHQFECFKQRTSIVPCIRGCDPTAESIVAPPEWFLADGDPFVFTPDGKRFACLWKKRGSLDRFIFSRLSSTGCQEWENMDATK